MKMTDARRLRMGPAGLAVATLSAVVVLALGGCSGAGMSSRTLTEAPVQLLAADQMTVLTLLRGWLKVLYEPFVPPGDSHLEFEPLPDGTVHIFGTDGWGKPYDQVIHPDQSGTEKGVNLNDLAFTKSRQLVSADAQATVWHYTTEYEDMRLEYDFTSFAAVQGARPYRLAGEMALTDGRRLTVQLDDNGVDLHRLAIGLPDDDVALACEIPVVFRGARAAQPRYHSSLTGAASAPSGDISFSMAGTAGVWSASTLSAGGISGKFRLEPSLAGGGTFKRDGKALGVLGWKDDMVGRLDLTSLETVEVTPVAAARDLSIDKWISGSARLGPG